MGKLEAQIDYASDDAARMQTGSCAGRFCKGSGNAFANQLLIDRVARSAFLFHVNSCEILLPLCKHSRLAVKKPI